jgi:hypothetical protein
MSLGKACSASANHWSVNMALVSSAHMKVCGRIQLGSDGVSGSWARVWGVRFEVVSTRLRPRFCVVRVPRPSAERDVVDSQ